MPKSIFIDPSEERRPGVVTAPEIPVNAYTPDPKKEAQRYGPEALVGMYRDMAVIREFELMLDSVKKTGAYEGIPYSYRGPAHLSIGQEAAAVGQAFHLTPDDYIFGSHRSHGEILAKSLSAIAKLSDDELLDIMETYMDGITLRAVEKFARDTDVKDLAVTYVLYGVLAEILGKETGFSKGLGGSMHAFFPPFGVMPNNAIVGGSADIATGAALFKRIRRKPGIVIANIGDASMGCGPVWEAMMLAAMDQYRTLWPKEIGGAPPILFNFVDNFYGMGGQPQGETMGFGKLVRVALGVNPQAMHAERVDGYNPLAVADAIERKKKLLLEGKGPVLLDTVTYRFVGHSPSDAMTYRTKEELEAWKEQDSLVAFARYLEENRHADHSQLEAFHAEIKEKLIQVYQAAISPEISPRPDLSTDILDKATFSHEYADRLAEEEPEVLLPMEKTRFKLTSKKARFGLDERGNKLSNMKALTYAEALFEAMLYRFYHDPTMVAYGEENRDWGGAFGVYRGLTEALPYHRLFNTPISEGAIVGSAVGYAMSGGRVVVELMYSDFMGRAGDEIFNQMAKWQAMSAGYLKMPLVLRVSVGSKYGAQHSQDWSSIVAHIPGLKVMFPATPYDAKGMLNLAPGPGGLLRKSAALPRTGSAGRRRRPRGLLRGAAGRTRGPPERERRHHPDPGRRALPCAGRRQGTRDQVRNLRGGDRPQVHKPSELRTAGGFGQENRKGDPGVGCRGEGVFHAHRGFQPGTTGVRLPGRTSGGPRSQELDHAAGRSGRGVLPAEGMDHRRTARTDPAAPRAPGYHQAGAIGNNSQKQAWGVRARSDFAIRRV